MDKRVTLFDLDFLAYHSVEEVARDVLNREIPEPRRVPLMITPNVDQIVKLDRSENRALKKALSRAQWILPDGQPIVTLSKIMDSSHNLPSRITGSDFFPFIWNELVKNKKIKVYFIVSRKEMGERFKAQRENTQYYAPPFFDLKQPEEFGEVMNNIFRDVNEFDPDFIFIGLGFPKQEHIALELYSSLPGEKKLPKVFLLGASFEFYFGLKKRAPLIWQKMGMEFVHRLFSEPRRMFRRYLIDDVAFVKIALKELRKK